MNPAVVFYSRFESSRYIGDVFIILKIEVSFVRIEKNFKSQGINCYASRVPLAAWTASVLFL